MNIFESLENINVSEGCFNEIVTLVEEYINEISHETVNKVQNMRRANWDKAIKDEEKIKKYSTNKQEHYDAEDKNLEMRVKDNKNTEITDKWRRAKNSGKIKPAKKEQEGKEKED